MRRNCYDGHFPDEESSLQRLSSLSLVTHLGFQPKSAWSCFLENIVSVSHSNLPQLKDNGDKSKTRNPLWGIKSVLIFIIVRKKNPLMSLNC